MPEMMGKERRSSAVKCGGTRWRSGAETPFNLMFEARA